MILTIIIVLQDLRQHVDLVNVIGIILHIHVHETRNRKLLLNIIYINNLMMQFIIFSLSLVEIIKAALTLTTCSGIANATLCM